MSSVVRCCAKAETVDSRKAEIRARPARMKPPSLERLFYIILAHAFAGLRAQFAHMAFEGGPRFGAEMLLPAPVEIGQRRPERSGIGLIKHHAALFQCRLQRSVQRHI